MDELNTKSEYNDTTQEMVEYEAKQEEYEKWEAKYKDEGAFEIIKELKERIDKAEEEIRLIKGEKEKFDRKRYNLKMYKKRIEKLRMIKCECGKEFREDRKIFHMTSQYHKKRIAHPEDKKIELEVVKE